MKNGTFRLRRGGQRGVASVEFGILLIILVPLFIGVVDFGQILHAQYVITRAAREGVMASMRGQDAQTVVNQYLDNAGLDRGHAGVDVQSSGTPGEDLKVTVTYDMSDALLIPWGGFVPLSNLSTTATGRDS